MRAHCCRRWITAVAMNANGDYGIQVPITVMRMYRLSCEADTELYRVVNKMVWRKF